MRTKLMMVVVAGLAVALGGCASAPAGSMSKGELATVRSSQTKVRVGESKDGALKSYGDKANKVRMSSASLEGAAIEEWKIEAFNDDGDRGRDLFVTFLYFRNDVLVDMSDTRLDFRNNPALTARWAHPGAK